MEFKATFHRQVYSWHDPWILCTDQVYQAGHIYVLLQQIYAHPKVQIE